MPLHVCVRVCMCMCVRVRVCVHSAYMEGRNNLHEWTLSFYLGIKQVICHLTRLHICFWKIYNFKGILNNIIRTLLKKKLDIGFHSISSITTKRQALFVLSLVGNFIRDLLICILYERIRGSFFVKCVARRYKHQKIVSFGSLILPWGPGTNWTRD